MAIKYISYMLTISLGCIFELFILNKFLGYELRIKKLPLILTAVGLSAIMFVVAWKRPPEDSDIFMALFYMVIPYFVLKPHRKIQFLLFGFVMDGFFDTMSQITIMLFKADVTSPLLNAVVSAWFFVCLLISLILYYKKQFVIPKFFLEKIPALFYILFCFALLLTILMLNSDIDIIASAEVYFAGAFVILAFIGLSYIVFRYVNVSMKQKEDESNKK